MADPTITQVGTPSGASSVADINAARAAAVASGGNPYAGAGATNLSTSAGLQNAPTTVITSNAAQDHIDTTVKPNTDALNQAIAAQNAKVAADKATQDANNAAQAEKDKQTQIELNKAKLDQSVQDNKAKVIQAAAGGTGGPTDTTQTPPPKNVQPYADVNGTNPNNWQVVTNQDGSVQTATRNSDGSYTPVDQNLVSQANAQAQLAQSQAAYQAEADKVTTAINNIANGVIPLNAGEQAQVDGLKQSYQQLIDQQTLANTNATGAANVRGYQTGAAEYDPTFQTKTIGTIVTGGLNKIADLNVKMAGAVATLTDQIKQNDIANIKSAWDVFSAASDKRTTQLQKTITDTAAAIKDAKDDYYNQVTKPINDIATEAAKNGADSKTVAAITAAGSVTGAINAAGDSLQTATGQLGDYLQYKRDATANGLTPQDYGTWKAADDAKQAQQKYAEAYGTEAGKNAADNAAGGSSGGDYGNAKVQNALEQQFRTALEKEASSRSGTYGLNDAKVSQGNKLAALFNQSYDPKTGNYNLNSQQYGELAEGLAALVSGSAGGASDADVAMIKAATAKGDWNEVFTYVTGEPANGSTQAIINSLAQSVERESLQAQSDRDAKGAQIDGLAPTGLDPARAAKLIANTGVQYMGIKGIASGNVNSYVKANGTTKLPNGSTLSEAVAQMYEVPGATDESVWQAILSAQEAGTIPTGGTADLNSVGAQNKALWDAISI